MLATAIALLVTAAQAPSHLPAVAAPSRLQALAWLEGTWQGRDGALEMEEVWTAPKGGTMLGLHRDVKGERTVGFEFLRIEETPDGVVYQAMPQGRPPTPFRLKEATVDRVVFENPEHDFPQRILYWKAADGALHARVEGTRGGRASSMEWRWERKP